VWHIAGPLVRRDVGQGHRLVQKVLALIYIPETYRPRTLKTV